MNEFIGFAASMLKDYGVGGASLGFAFYVVYRTINSMERKEAASTASHQRFADSLDKVTDEHRTNMQEISRDLRERADCAKEFQHFVRTEHLEQQKSHIIFSEQQKVLTEQMKEVCSALGRINGYKK